MRPYNDPPGHRSHRSVCIEDIGSHLLDCVISLIRGNTSNIAYFRISITYAELLHGKWRQRWCDRQLPKPLVTYDSVTCHTYHNSAAHDIVRRIHAIPGNLTFTWVCFCFILWSLLNSTGSHSVSKHYICQLWCRGNDRQCWWHGCPQLSASTLWVVISTWWHILH